MKLHTLEYVNGKSDNLSIYNIFISIISNVKKKKKKLHTVIHSHKKVWVINPERGL